MSHQGTSRCHPLRLYSGSIKASVRAIDTGSSMHRSVLGSPSETLHSPQRGLFRATLARPGMPLADVFDGIRQQVPESSFWSDDHRGISGAQLKVDREHGAGHWQFLRMGSDLFVAATDSIYDHTREETVVGEGRYELYVKLSGKLRMEAPRFGLVEVAGPAALLMYHEKGAVLQETLTARLRETCVSVHCRPEFLRALLDADNANAADVLTSISQESPFGVRQFPLTPGLAGCVRSILSCQLRGRTRLLYQEAKVLELICLSIEALDQSRIGAAGTLLRRADPRLDRARNLLSRQAHTIPSVRELARSIGMCESKLKREFKHAFGQTIFDFALERRMAMAMDLLREGSMPISEVAANVGYRHHTSFTAAFRRFYGFPPKVASR